MRVSGVGCLRRGYAPAPLLAILDPSCPQTSLSVSLSFSEKLSPVCDESLRFDSRREDRARKIQSLRRPVPENLEDSHFRVSTCF
jgi:hypothetical protein